MNDPSIAVRPMGAEDLEQVRLTLAESVGRAPGPEVWRGYLDDPVNFCLVAERDGRVAGVILLAVVAGEVSLHQLAVRSGERGRGIGTRLFGAAVAAARGRHARVMFLEVRERNHVARRLYRRCGCVPVGRRRGYYTAPADDALLLRLDL